MKRIICLILVLASLVSFSSCGKPFGKKKENSELALKMVKEAVWIVEAIAGVTITDVLQVNPFGYEWNSSTDTYELYFLDTNDVVHRIDCIYLNQSDDESERLFAEAAYNAGYSDSFVYWAHHTFNSIEPDNRDIDIKWINSEFQTYKNNSDLKILSTMKIMSQSAFFLNYIEEKNFVSLNSDWKAENTPDRIQAHFGCVQYLWNSLTEAERKEVGHFDDPIYRFTSMIACNAAIQDIKQDLVNPASLQVHSQSVIFYKKYANDADDRELDYAIVESDCSAQNRIGGYVRESFTKVMKFKCLSDCIPVYSPFEYYGDPSEIKEEHPQVGGFYTYKYNQ